MFIRPLISLPSFLFTLVFFGFESIVRFIVSLTPKFIIVTIDSVIRMLFPKLSKSYKEPRVSPLEFASTFEEMINYWNYDYEEHYVRTRDLYLLCLHRLRYSRSESGHSHQPPKYQLFDNSQIEERIYEKRASITNNLDRFHNKYKHGGRRGYKGKPVVLLWHGLTLTSEVWISNIEEKKNLALYLVERGYDVWMGNARGNKYSQSHLSKNPKNGDFWEFSINEFAMLDLPDTVNFILKKTGAPNLTYIGFSQGTAQAFAGLSINPDLNEKINLFIALAPAATPKGFSSTVLDGFIKAAPSLIYCLLGRKIFLKSVLFWQRIISPPLFVKLIDGAVSFLFGWHCKNMPEAQKLVSYQHLFSTTSVKSIVHWFQIISSGRFQMYDETPSLLPYSTVNTVIDHLPAKFPTRQITTPIAVFYGSNDTLVDFDILQSDLPPLVYVKNVHGYEHMDFLWATGLERKVYPDIIKLLKHFNNTTIDEENNEGFLNNSDYIRKKQQQEQKLKELVEYYKLDNSHIPENVRLAELTVSNSKRKD